MNDSKHLTKRKIDLARYNKIVFTTGCVFILGIALLPFCLPSEAGNKLTLHPNGTTSPPSGERVYLIKNSMGRTASLTDADLDERPHLTSVGGAREVSYLHQSTPVLATVIIRDGKATYLDGNMAVGDSAE
jgi:hypothetical protein